MSRKRNVKEKKPKPSPEPEIDYDEAFAIEEPRELKLVFQMIVKRNLPKEAAKWSQEEVVAELNKITHLRLDRENIGYIDNLELLGASITNVYLQHNHIKKIENLDCLPNLRFLALSSNKIRVIEGLSHLKHLGFLDLSDNLIQTFDIDELPQSLVILNLKNNPCTYTVDHRGRIIQDLPKLRQLDEEEVTKTEKRETGYVVSSDTEEEDDEEEEEEEAEEEAEEEVTGAAPPLSNQSIIEIFAKAACDILLRSQDRLESELKEHIRKMDMLDDIREESDLPPSTARSTARSTAQGSTGPGAQAEAATGPIPKNLKTKKHRSQRDRKYDYDSDST